MNNQQINQYDMYLRVQKVMRSYQSIWVNNTRINANVTAFEQAVKDIDGWQRKKVTAQTNIAESKMQLKKQLIDVTGRVVKAVQSFAKDENNQDLYAAIDYTKTSLTSMRESQLPYTCQKVHDKTIAYLPQLGDYGVREALLTQLQIMIEQFKALLPEAQVVISENKTATESLVDLFKNTSNLLREQLDGKLEQFQDSHADFYNAYTHARAIIDRAKSGKGEEKVGV